uniref:Uncharacterized protein n=1 Tax=Chlorobium chlorochromatii (strain CaD3) TaxID=340177 RepID=Q3AQW2_CHLCH
MKSQITEQFQQIGLDDLKIHPELLTDILSNKQDLSLILEKRGDIIRYAYLRTYDSDSRKILEEAKAEYCLKKEDGYSREEAFQDFEDVQHDIATQLASRVR